MNSPPPLIGLTRCAGAWQVCTRGGCSTCSLVRERGLPRSQGGLRDPGSPAQLCRHHMSSGRKPPPANSSLRGHGLIWQARGHRFVSPSLVRCLVLERDLPRSPGGLRALSACPSWTEDEISLRSLQRAADHLHSHRHSNLAGTFQRMLLMLPHGRCGAKMVNM